MTAVFLKVLNMSLAAGWLILAVLVLRLPLRRAPRWALCLLWGLVALRLACPFSIESALSLVPSARVFELSNIRYETPQVHTGIYAVNSVVNPVLSETFTPNPGDSVNPLFVWTSALSVLWIAGVAAMLLYAIGSYIRVYRSVRERAPMGEDVYFCDGVSSPFILGWLRPRIYLPSDIDGEALESVLAHERAHIARRDYLWKPLGFLLLAVHWFNPLCWAAYLLLCRDIELACDEKVIRRLDLEGRKAYSHALVSCGAQSRPASACPLAFGEVGVKQRVKSALSYKKPAVWVIAAAVLVCAAAAVCFLTDPVSAREPDLSFLNYENAISAAADAAELQAIYCPEKGDEIRIGYAEGAELAKYLDLVDWTRRGDPSEKPASPGSVEFCITDDYRITVYQKPRLARVTFYDEVRYYKTHGGDYEAALALVYGEPRQLTLEDVKELARKGEALAVEDLKGYYGEDQGGFGLQITRYDIDERYYLLAGGGTEGPLTYARLHVEPEGDEIDIRTEDVAGFLEAHADEAAAAEAALAQLREKYPEYFGLSTEKGLDVYVWKMAENSCYFGLMEGTAREEEPDQWELLKLKGVSAEDMKLILSTYGLPPESITVKWFGNPISSYLVLEEEIPAILETARQMLGL